MSFITEIAADNPAFHFAMNETSGTAATDEEGGSDGTYSGTLTLNQTGVIEGVSVLFDGGTMITPIQTLSSQSATIMLGFRTGSDVTTEQVLVHCKAGEFTFSIKSGSLDVWWNRGGGAPLSVAIAANTSYLVHVHGSNSGSEPHYRLYINGSEVDTFATDPGTRVISTNNNYWNVGDSDGIARDGTGTVISAGAALDATHVDCLAVFLSVLSNARITAHFDASLLASTGADVVTITGSSATAGTGTIVIQAAVIVTITGTSATAGVGTLVVTDQVTITGTSATAGSGTLVVTEADIITITGSSATAGVGVLVVTDQVTIIGTSATAGAGTLVVEAGKVITITGSSATAGVGTLVVTDQVTITGTSATAGIGTLVVTDLVVITGTSATAGTGTLVIVEGDTVTITGSSATAGVGSLIVTDQVTILGSSATAGSGTLIVQAAVIVTITGSSATASVGTLVVTDLVVIVGDESADVYLDLPGSSNNVASATIENFNTVTTSYEFITYVQPDDWSPASPMGIGGWANDGILLLQATGTLRLRHNTITTGAETSTSSVATGFTDGTGHWLRAVITIATDSCSFYTSNDEQHTPPEDVTWTLLGTADRSFSADISTSVSETAFVAGGRTTTTSLFAGKIYSLLLNIDGTTELDVRFFNEAAGTTSFTEDSANADTITVNGTAVIVNSEYGTLVVTDQVTIIGSSATAGTGTLVVVEVDVVTITGTSATAGIGTLQVIEGGHVADVITITGDNARAQAGTLVINEGERVVILGGGARAITGSLVVQEAVIVTITGSSGIAAIGTLDVITTPIIVSISGNIGSTYTIGSLILKGVLGSFTGVVGDVNGNEVFEVHFDLEIDSWIYPTFGIPILKGTSGVVFRTRSYRNAISYVRAQTANAQNALQIRGMNTNKRYIVRNILIT